MAEQKADLELLSEKIITKANEIRTKQKLLEDAGLENLQQVIDYGIRKKKQVEVLNERLKSLEEEISNPMSEDQYKGKIKELEEELKGASELLESREQAILEADAEREERYRKIKEAREKCNEKAINGLEAEFNKELRKSKTEYERALKIHCKKCKMGNG